MTSKRVSSAARQLIVGRVLLAVADGLTVPLTLIYLNQVRGIPLAVVGTLFAAMAVMSLVSVPFAGALLDRVGARPVLTVAIAGQALAALGLVWVDGTLAALAVMLLRGAALGPSFPAFGMLMAGLDEDPERQQRAFAVSFTWMNAAMGLGAAVTALVADVQDKTSFQAMFVACAVLALAASVIVSRLPNVRPPAREEKEEKAGYREVLASPGLRSVMVAAFVLAFAGYAAVDSGLPAYASVVSDVPVNAVALALTVNTIVVVVAQLLVLRLVRRLRRSRALALIGLIWGVSWAVLGLSAVPAGETTRIALIFAFSAIFALGETVFAPTFMPLVNTLADVRVRGRANAMATGTLTLAHVASPAISTGMISANLEGAWIVLLGGGCALVVLLGMRLGRQLTPEQDRLTVAEESSATAAV